MQTPSHSERGFTLIEVMITVAIVAILSAIALPSYTAYVQRSRIPVALDALSAVATRLEQRYQDTGNYADGADDAACGVAMPAVENFALACVLSDGGQGFTVTATGAGRVAGFAYTINHQGVRVTTAHPKGAPAANCWSLKGGTCDT